jgi:antitoxin component of MazEF toxin-antitoxin module
MLNYYRSVQRPQKSYHIDIPKPLIDILDLKKNQIVNIDKGEKVIVIRALHEATKEEGTTTERIIS